jgi:hypothetical protein
MGAPCTHAGNVGSSVHYSSDTVYYTSINLRDLIRESSVLLQHFASQMQKVCLHFAPESGVLTIISPPLFPLRLFSKTKGEISIISCIPDHRTSRKCQRLFWKSPSFGRIQSVHATIVLQASVTRWSLKTGRNVSYAVELKEKINRINQLKWP